MKVELVDHMGTDRSVLRAMRVSLGKDGGEGGGDMNEWPADLRVREFPVVQR